MYTTQASNKPNKNQLKTMETAENASKVNHRLFLGDCWTVAVCARLHRKWIIARAHQHVTTWRHEVWLVGYFFYHPVVSLTQSPHSAGIADLCMFYLPDTRGSVVPPLLARGNGWEEVNKKNRDTCQKRYSEMVTESVCNDNRHTNDHTFNSYQFIYRLNLHRLYIYCFSF